MKLNTIQFSRPSKTGAWGLGFMNASVMLILVDVLLIFTLAAGFQFAADRQGEGLVISGEEQGS